MADQRIEVIGPSTLLASASPRSRLLNILRYPHVRPQTFWTSTETLSPASLRFSSLSHVISGLTLGFGPLQGRFPNPMASTFSQTSCYDNYLRIGEGNGCAGSRAGLYSFDSR